MQKAQALISPESRLAVHRQLVQALKDAGLGRLIGSAEIEITDEGLKIAIVPFNEARLITNQLSDLVEGRPVTVQNPTGQAEPAHISQIKSSLQSTLTEQHAVPAGYKTAAVKVTK